MWLDQYPELLKHSGKPSKGRLDHLGRGVIRIKSLLQLIEFIRTYVGNRSAIFHYSIAGGERGHVNSGDAHCDLDDVLSVMRRVLSRTANTLTYLEVISLNPFDPTVRVSITFDYVKELDSEQFTQYFRVECRSDQHDLFNYHYSSTSYLKGYIPRNLTGKVANLIRIRHKALITIAKNIHRDDWVCVQVSRSVLDDIHKRHQNKYAPIMVPKGYSGDAYSTLLYCNRALFEIEPSLFDDSVKKSPLRISFPKLIYIRQNKSFNPMRG